MVIEFSRNPNKFALNKYIQVVPVKKTVGYYLNLTAEEAARLQSTEGDEFAWPDGADAPLGNEGAESFEFLAYTAKRKLYRANIGDLASEQASWDLMGFHQRAKAQQAMTARTSSVIATLTNTANYPAANTASATTAGGGMWKNATTANLYIKKSIDYAVNVIIQGTLATVEVGDLQLVISPTLAKEMAESQELVDYIKGSPLALAQIRGELPGGNVEFGLPEMYAGVKIVVEKTVKVTSKKGATKAASYVLAADKPFIASRPGGLIGVAGAPSFSTGTLFVYEKDEMTVETLHDVDNRRTSTRVIDNYAAVVTAGVAGFAFTGAS